MIPKASRFIRNRTGIPRIPPLRSLSHVKRRGLRGSESAAKGGLANVLTLSSRCVSFSFDSQPHVTAPLQIDICSQCLKILSVNAENKRKFVAI